METLKEATLQEAVFHGNRLAQKTSDRLDHYITEKLQAKSVLPKNSVLSDLPIRTPLIIPGIP